MSDSALSGLDPAGLSRIVAPVLVLTGGASHPFYGPIAAALVARIRGARHATLDGLTHNAPITDAARVADAIRSFLTASRLLPATGTAPSLETAP